MSILHNVCTLALRPLLNGACQAVGVQSGEAVVNFLVTRFTDHSQRVSTALLDASDRAWKALEVALAGDSFCTRLTTRTEDRAFSEQVRAFLDAAPLPVLAGKAQFRQKCCEELRAARKAGLVGGNLEARQLARQAAAFARFTEPHTLLDAEWRALQEVADGLKERGHGALAWFLAQRPPEGPPLLVVGVRYFFRRAVEQDAELARGLHFAQLESLGKTQEAGFAALSAALAQQGDRFEELLGDVKQLIERSHADLLDVKAEQQRQGTQVQVIYQAVMQLLDQRQLGKRPLRAGDSLSVRDEGERQLVKQMVARYRALPEDERQQLPALLNAVGKLQVVTGDYDAAQRDFQQVATLVAEPTAQAQAHFNAYQAALERRDWASALPTLLEAARLDGRAYAPFPVAKYQPQRILGAGGFGVAFLCRHTELNAPVVVKTLAGDELARAVDEVFTEARVLYQLDHPCIIRLLDCGYTFPAEKARPYFVMNFFDGKTLEGHVAEHGTLAPDDAVAVARLVAQGLEAAHGKGILHRDVKPANLLVRKDGEPGASATGGRWQVKLIDFGLALRHSAEAAVSTSVRARTLVGSSIAGTLDYAAPEQMGKLPGVPVGRAADVYGFGKTICYALFKTTQPLPKHFRTLPESLAVLLEDCLEESPENRPANFAAVLERLGGARPQLLALPVEALPAVTAAPGIWHYLKDGKQYGPVPQAAIYRLVAEQRLAPTDLIWKEGMAGWAPINTVLPAPTATTAAAFPQPPARVSGKLILHPEMQVGVEVKFSLDGVALGEGSLSQGCELPLETLTGEHTLEVVTTVSLAGLMKGGVKVHKYPIAFREGGLYRLTLQFKSGFLGMSQSFALDVQKLPGQIPAGPAAPTAPVVAALAATPAAVAPAAVSAAPTQPPAEVWYYTQKGQQGGPVSFEQLQQLAQKGQLAPTDLVWSKSLGSWVQAATVQGLCPELPPAPPPLPTPPASDVGNKARIQFLVPPASNLAHATGKAIRGYVKLATYGLVGGKVFGSDVLKFYHGNKLLGEGPLVQGFALEVTLPTGAYKVAVAHWVGSSESDRKEFDLSFGKPGTYQVRFNYVRGVMGGMSGSTIEVLQEPA